MNDSIFEVKIKTSTPIWTGDEDRNNTALRETGIIGSLRWWYEALVRGLGGTACDPTCNECKNDSHCDACELFGCTGWARKFRLEVEKLYGDNFGLRFIVIREMKEIEWALLNKTINIISQYGAIGGKIAESGYGIIRIEKNDLNKFTLKKEDLNSYLMKKGKLVDNLNLSRFIFINKNLNYATVKAMKSQLSFLKGYKDKGKRYFYKTLKEKPCRFFAYAKDGSEYKQIVAFLESKSVQFVEGKKLLEELQ